MLLANTSVARTIASGLPEQSLLRRHEGPIERRIVSLPPGLEMSANRKQEAFVNRARKLGFEFESTRATDLQRGFDAVKDQDAALCLELLKKKAMQRSVWTTSYMPSLLMLQRARYFCTGMLDIAKYSHWSLATPLYTHFTVSNPILARFLLRMDQSPIRRYVSCSFEIWIITDVFRPMFWFIGCWTPVSPVVSKGCAIRALADGTSQSQRREVPYGPGSGREMRSAV